MIDRRDLVAWALSLMGDRWNTLPAQAKGLSADRIVMIDRQVRARFQYRHPIANQAWVRDDAVKAHQAWQGNCVTLTMTTLDMIRRAGAPVASLYVLIVLDWEYKGQHAVGLVLDDFGRYWVVGDTFSPAYPYALMRHKLVQKYRFT